MQKTVDIDKKGEEVCLVCEGNETENLYSGQLRKCSECGFITANLDLTRAEIKDLYGEKYFKGEEYLDYINDKSAIQKNFRKKFRTMRRIAGEKEIRSLLEIGCAYGFFGEVVKIISPGTKYLGLDVSEEAIHYASEKLDLTVSGIDYLSLPVEKKYTDICMWDVIEHLQRPDLFIEKIHSDLLPGGRIWMTTGNIEALIPRIMGSRWRMIHPPTHLHYFSSKTLTRLLRKKGFDIKRITYPAVSRGLKQMFYSTFMLGKEPGKITRKIYSLIPDKVSFSINTFDIMFLLAERK
jgi:2-polyprenyl-3-methyl-5-hydroxy-6-metoxy-1,4-benzoquinol methylase